MDVTKLYECGFCRKRLRADPATPAMKVMSVGNWLAHICFQCEQKLLRLADAREWEVARIVEETRRRREG